MIEYPEQLSFLRQWVTHFGRGTRSDTLLAVRSVKDDNTLTQLNGIANKLVSPKNDLCRLVTEFAAELRLNGFSKEADDLEAFADGILSSRYVRGPLGTPELATLQHVGIYPWGS